VKLAAALAPIPAVPVPRSSTGHPVL
jgi:hypothetical protein